MDEKWRKESQGRTSGCRSGDKPLPPPYEQPVTIKVQAGSNVSSSVSCETTNCRVSAKARELILGPGRSCYALKRGCLEKTRSVINRSFIKGRKVSGVGFPFSCRHIRIRNTLLEWHVPDAFSRNSLGWRCGVTLGLSKGGVLRITRYVTQEAASHASAAEPSNGSPQSTPYLAVLE